MPESRLPFEIESLADHARRLWLEAQGEAITARVELFVKLSLRSRIARDLTRCGVARDHSYESGIAMRLLQPGSARAEFAAASGMTSEVLRWTLHTAGGLGARVTAMAPRPSDVTESERWDLDAAAPLPDEEVLTAIVMSREELEWVEAGTTLEVLVGEGGWVAARRRNRVWALIRRDGATLKAQRGFAGLEGLVESGSADFSFGKESPSNDLKVLVLSPDAASSLVVALAGAFHAAEVNPAARVGPGWVVSDEPSHLGGLAGGSFDDAGFPAASRVLAADGVWKAGLSGPGTLRRGSFREPPRESVTNLLIPAGEQNSVPAGATYATRCRVHRLTRDLWVVELDIITDSTGDGLERRWIPVRPEALLAACAGRLGGTRVTALGPIVPSLVLEGLAAARDE